MTGLRFHASVQRRVPEQPLNPGPWQSDPDTHTLSHQVSPSSDCWEWDHEALGLVFYSFISVESTHRLDEVDLMLAQI